MEAEKFVAITNSVTKPTILSSSSFERKEKN